jgi:hypothetical protein
MGYPLFRAQQNGEKIPNPRIVLADRFCNIISTAALIGRDVGLK